jgi:cytochrome c oxidase subunit III
MRMRVVQHIQGLQPYGHGVSSPTWWGTIGFIALEAMGFAIAIGTYLYLAVRDEQWPLGAAPPNPLVGSILLIVLLISVWPNMLSDRHARDEDLPRVRFDLVVMSLVGVATIVIRAFEFDMLHVSWDSNAYGSIVWALLGLHTLHLVTDVADTIVLTALMFTRHAHGRRFSDVTDNAFYWQFVVLSWILIYVLLYWVPRL